MKTCPKCGDTKAVTEFGKHAGRGDGLQAYCRSCKNQVDTRYRAANSEKEMARHAKYRDDNREMLRVKARERFRANPEKQKASTTKYLATHPGVKLIMVHNYRARKAGGKLSKDVAERLYILQRGKCACCRTPLGDNYHRDHHMPLALGGPNTDDNIQLLCPTCNLQKSAKHPIDFMQQRGFLL